jgi:hypothetical protein
VAVSSSKKSLFDGWRGQNAAKKKVRSRKSKNAQAFANDSTQFSQKFGAYLRPAPKNSFTKMTSLSKVLAKF